MPKEKFLVTGCAGFIGSHMVNLLLEKGYAVCGVDDLSTGKMENIAPFPDAFEFFKGSLCDTELTARALRDVTRIIHLASIPSVPRSIANPLENMHSSITATVTLFDQAAKTGMVKRIVQASSSAVYGDSEASPKTEDMFPDALSPYAAAKLSQEFYGQAFRQILDVASLRYFNVFGPRQDPNGDYAAVIPKFVSIMLTGKEPTIFGDGKQTRDFIYVRNVVEANLAVALHEGDLRGEAFNVATGESMDLNELTKRINTMLGTSIAPTYAPERPGEVKHSCADVTRFTRRIGYMPTVGFDEGLLLTKEAFA